MRVTVDQAREQDLSASVVDLSVGIRLHDGVGRADRCDLVAVDGERHIVLNGVDRHDGRMREDDRTARRRLSLDATLLDKEGGGAGAGCGEQLPSTEVE